MKKQNRLLQSLLGWDLTIVVALGLLILLPFIIILTPIKWIGDAIKGK